MKKISTLFKKDPNDLSLVIDEINPGNEWVFTDGIPTRKYDGIACAIINGFLYKRRDIKKGKNVPHDAIPCQEPDVITGHWPHWVRCERGNNDDKYFFEAFDQLGIKLNGSYELCGESISTERFTKNFNAENITGHMMIPHGEMYIELPYLSFYGIKAYLAMHDIEGIVFKEMHGERMCKIRKKDFGFKR